MRRALPLGPARLRELTLVSDFTPLVTGERWGLLEAPRANERGGVTFSDVTNGGVHRVDGAGQVSALLDRRRGIGGLVPHRQGGYVVSGRDLARLGVDGTLTTLLAPEGVRGFNDLTTTPDGDVLAGGLRFSPMAGEDPAPGEIWRLRPGGEADVVFTGITWPNGLGLSPDGATFYAADFQTGEVLTAPAAGGELETFAAMPRGSADGLAVDAEGHVWVALGQGAGLARLRPGGELDAVVDVPAEFVSSVSFGGEDLRDLFVTTAGALLTARCAVAGLPVASAAV